MEPFILGQPAPLHAGNLRPPEGTIKPGERRPTVNPLQGCLVRLKYQSAQDKASEAGVMGPRTQDALKNFQADWQIYPDGIYGHPTEAALNEAFRDKKEARTWNVGAAPPGEESPSDTDDPPEWKADNNLADAEKLPNPQYYFGSITNKWVRRLFMRIRDGFDVTNSQGRQDFRAKLRETLLVPASQDTVGAVNMPGWVKLTRAENPQPAIWKGVKPGLHHDDKDGYCADINASCKEYKYDGIDQDHSHRILKVFGPMVEFTVEKRFLVSGLGGCPIVRMAGTDWLYHFGHMSEISSEVWHHANSGDANKPLPPGTYLGTCRAWIGITTDPHCHIQVWSTKYDCSIPRDYWQPLLTDPNADFASLDKAMTRDKIQEATDFTRALWLNQDPGSVGDFDTSNPNPDQDLA